MYAKILLLLDSCVQGLLIGACNDLTYFGSSTLSILHCDTVLPRAGHASVPGVVAASKEKKIQEGDDHSDIAGSCIDMNCRSLLQGTLGTLHIYFTIPF